MDERNCSVTLYGQKEYDETLANISACSLYVENSSRCTGDEYCVWKVAFESGVCLVDSTMTITTTTMEATTNTTTAGDGGTTTAGDGATTTGGDGEIGRHPGEGVLKGAGKGVLSRTEAIA